MSAADELDNIAAEMTEILGRFRNTSSGLHIAPGDGAHFAGLVLEAHELISTGLGPSGAAFAVELRLAKTEGTLNYLQTQSYHSVEQAAGIVRSAAKVIRRRGVQPPGAAIGISAPPPYVSLARMEELRGIGSPGWDLRRLVRMCEELNSAFAAGNFLASAMLLRAIIDHVPPIFAAPTFSQFASSIAGRSIKGSMERLQSSSRHVSDTWLHQQIRSSETLPTATQVDFRQELDALLGEVCRALPANSRLGNPL
jgi:hypothetical protein